MAAVTTKIVRAFNPHSKGQYKGTFTVNIRITYERRSAFIPTSIKVGEKDLNAAGEVMARCKYYKDIKEVNKYLKEQREKVESFIMQLEKSDEILFMKAADIKHAYQNRKSVIEIDFIEYGRKQAIKEREKGSIGNGNNYDDALDFLVRRTGKKRIAFRELNYNMLKEVEDKHIRDKFKYNSLSVYLRAIRAIYNRAIKDDEIDISQDDYPFKKYKIKEEKTKKRAIAREDIMKFEKYKPEFRSPEFHAHNLFMFSFYMIGMNFTDMAYLQYKNVKKDRLVYIRKKNNKEFNLALSDKAKAILEIYRTHNFYHDPKKLKKDKDSYVFPIIKRSDPQEIKFDIKNGLKQMNKYIRKIAGKLEIDEHLTSYVARHSWASIGKKLNVSLAAISDSMGHSDMKTTEIYLDELDTSVIDDTNKLITG